MAEGKRKIQYGIRFEADTSGLKEVVKQLQQIQNKAAANNKAFQTSGAQLNQELQRAGAEAKTVSNIINNSWNPKLGTFNFGKLHQEINKTYGGVKQFKTAMSQAGLEGVRMYSNIAKTSMTANIQIKQSSHFLNKMAETMMNSARWQIATKIYTTISDTLRNAYNYTKKLDTSLNKIRIVTNKSSKDMQEFAKYANQAAKDLSTSTTKYTDASLIYYQQGLSDAEVKARTETTLKVANVTGMTAEAASENLTAVWNGYKVNARETELYMDKLSAVAATTASDLEELSIGMSKVSSTANTVGVNIDQLAAQIATIVSVTRQAPESVGTALKTIYARLGDLEVSGVDEFGTSLGEVSSQMETVGVSVLDETGDLRDMGVVIEEVAKKWDTWTTAQKNAAAIAMAGKRQYNNLFALFENWDMYSMALKTSQEAEGTLEKQNATYEESVKAHLQALSTEAERTYAALFDPESVIGITDALNSVLDKINDFIEGIGGGTSALIMLGATFTRIFNKQIANSLSRSIYNFQAWRSNLTVQKGNQAFLQEGALDFVQNTQTSKVYTKAGMQRATATGATEAEKYEVESMKTVVNETAKDYAKLHSARGGLNEQAQSKVISLMQENIQLTEANQQLKSYQAFEKDFFGRKASVSDYHREIEKLDQYHKAVTNINSSLRKMFQGTDAEIADIGNKIVKNVKDYNKSMIKIDNKFRSDNKLQQKQLKGLDYDPQKQIKDRPIGRIHIKSFMKELDASNAKNPESTYSKAAVKFGGAPTPQQVLAQYLGYLEKHGAAEGSGRYLSRVGLSSNTKNAINNVLADPSLTKIEEVIKRINALIAEENNLRRQSLTLINDSTTAEDLSALHKKQQIPILQASFNISKESAQKIVQNKEISQLYFQLLIDINNIHKSNLTALEKEAQITQRIKEHTKQIDASDQRGLLTIQELNANLKNKEKVAGAKNPIPIQEEQIEANREKIDQITAQGKSNIKIQNVVSTLSAVSMGLTGIVGSLDTIIDKTAKASEKTGAWTSGLQSAFFSMSMIPHPIAQIAGTTLNLLTSVIGGVIRRSQEAKEKIIEEAKQAAEEAKAELDTNKTTKETLESLRAEYAYLAQGVNEVGQVTDLNATETQRYYEICNQVAELVPDIANGWDKNGNAIIANNNLIENGLKLIRQQNDELLKAQYNAEALKGFSEDLNTAADAHSKAQKAKNKISETEDVSYGLDGDNVGFTFLDLEDALRSTLNPEEYSQYYKKDGSLDREKLAVNYKAIVKQVNEKYDSDDYISAGGAGQISIDNFLHYLSIATESVSKDSRFQENQDALKKAEDDLQAAEEPIRQAMLADLHMDDYYQAATTEEERKFLDLALSRYQFTNWDKATAGKTALEGGQKLIENIEKAGLSSEERKEYTKLLDPNNFNSYQEHQAALRKYVEDNAESFGYGSDYAAMYQSMGFEASGADKDTSKAGYDLARQILAENENLAKEYNYDTEAFYNDFIKPNFKAEDIISGTISNLGGVNVGKLINSNQLKNVQNAIKVTEDLNKSVITNAENYKAANDAVIAYDSAISKLEDNKDLSEEDIKTIETDTSLTSEEAKEKQKELIQIRNKGSKEYLQLLKEIRELEEDNAISMSQNALQTSSDTLEKLNGTAEQWQNDERWQGNKKLEGLTIEDIRAMWTGEEDAAETLKDWLINDMRMDENLAVEVVANTQDFYTTMDEIQTQKYNVEVAINADLKSDVDEGFGIIDQVNEISDILSKGLTISTSDAQKMIEDGYGELLQNAETTSAGQILLNKETVNSFVDARQQEIEAQRDAKLTQLKTEKLVLEAQRDLQKKQLDLLTSGWEEKSKEEKAATLAKVHALSAEIDTVKSAANVELGVYAELNEEQRDQADKLYTYLTGQVQDQTDQAISAAEAQDRANKIMANNTISYYKDMATAATQYNQIVKDGAITTDSFTAKITDGDKIKGYKSNSDGDDNETSIPSFDTELDFTAHLLEVDESVIDAIYDKTYTELSNDLMTTEQQIGTIDATIASLLSSSSYLDVVQAELKGAVGDVIDLLDDEIDRFHQIDVAINRVTRSLEDLKTQQEKLTGDSLVQSMELQLSVLDKQSELLDKKMQIAQQQVDELAPILAAEGAIFDEQGSIANYVALLEAKQNQMNQAIMEYNAMSEDEQKANKEKKEQMDRDYEDFLKATEKYEEMVNETIPDLADEIQEIAEQQIELKIEQATVKVQVELDNIEYAKQYREYQNMRLAEDDYTGKMEDMLQQYTEYFDPNGRGSTQIYSDRLQFLLDQKAQMDATGTASAYGDNSAKLKEDLAEAYSNLIDAEKSLVDLEKSLWSTYLDGITNAFADNREILTRNDEEFEHSLKLLTLIGGKNIEGQEKLYQLQSLNNQYLVENAHSERKYWEDALEQAIANGETDERIADIEEKANEARKQENEALISALEDLKQVFEDRVTSLLDESFKGIEESSDQWEWAKKTESLYLDDINRLYEVQKLRNTMQSSIDETSNIKAQTQLREVMEEQLAILEKKEEVSKYDVDRANQLYDITLKQIALEDARNNKTQMRLRRDSQGNYNYQYVADENAVQNAEQELLNSINSLHNLNKERMTEMTDNIYSVTLELKEKLAEIATDETLTQEEKLAKMAETYEQYQEYIQELAEEQVFATNNLLEDTYTVTIPGFYATDAENFKHMINSNKDQLGYLLNWSDQIFKNMTDSSQQNFNAMSDAGKIAYNNLSDTQKNLLVETMLPEFNETILTMMDQFTQPGGFNDVTEDAYSRLIDLTQEYADEIEIMGDIAERNFDALRWGADEVTGSIDKLKSQTDLANQELQTQIEKCHDLYWAAKDLSSAFGEINTDNLVADAKETLLQWGETFNLMETMLGEWYTNSGSGKSIGWTVINGTGDYSGQSTPPPKTQDPPLEISDPNYARISNNNDGLLSKGDTPKFKTSFSGDSVLEAAWRQQYGRDLTPKEFLSYYGGQQIEIKSLQGGLVLYRMNDEERTAPRTHFETLLQKGSFDTGGYTGEWGTSNGKLAILHEKEIVLNKEDTKNILSAVKVVRGLDNIINSLNQSIENKINYLQNKINSITNSIQIPSLITSPNDNFEQNVTIHAEFPNVEKVRDIEEAFNNLVNYATQVANRKIK